MIKDKRNDFPLEKESTNEYGYEYDDSDIPPVDLPRDSFPEEMPADVIPDEVPRKDGPGGESGNNIF